MSLLKNCSDSAFIEIVQESDSIAEIERKLGYNSYSGSVSELIKDRINALQLDIQHFGVNQKIQRCPENIFILNSTASQKVLRTWYKKGEYSPYICSICGQQAEWQGKPLTLILDHVNGNNTDDRLENLRWVCPNCNQQLDTTGSRNTAYKDAVEYCCIDCGKPGLRRGTIRCMACEAKHRVATNLEKRQELISREELKNLIRTMPFTRIGAKFGVTDNAIRKWCDGYGLPRKVSDIKQYSDEEWAKI